MSADIIPMPQPKGNGAREALMEILSEPAVQMKVSFTPHDAADLILLKLAGDGFVIVPFEE